MTTIQGLDWDAYRKNYPQLSYRAQQAFHSEIYAQYPEQKHYSSEHVARAIEDTLPTSVFELGGWDGELAAEMLDRYPTIHSWTNYEICKEAAQAGDQRHPKYYAANLTDFYWEYGKHGKGWRCDLFVASHTIEHISANDLDKTVNATDAKAFFFDAPLLDWPINWMGSTTSHVLEIGWLEVHNLMRYRGYEPAWQEDHETEPGSGGHSRAVLYLRAT
jgi:hypothetical protein